MSNTLFSAFYGIRRLLPALLCCCGGFLVPLLPRSVATADPICCTALAFFAAAVHPYAHSCCCGVLLRCTGSGGSVLGCSRVPAPCGLLRVRPGAAAECCCCGLRLLRTAAAAGRSRVPAWLLQSFCGLRSADGHPAKSSSCVPGKLWKRLADVSCIGGGTSPDKALSCFFLFP